RGWVTFPRPKTAVKRRCPLWPETVAAIRAAMAKRPAEPKEEAAGLVFVTAQGRCWAKDDMSSPLVWKVSQLMSRLGINGRKGRASYPLRHTHRTVADEAKDQVAANFIMGHKDRSMAGNYRHHIADERLRAVTDHVHTWLFGDAQAKRRSTSLRA